MRVVKSNIQQTKRQLKQPECASRLKKRIERTPKKKLQNSRKISENRCKNHEDTEVAPKNGSGSEISLIFASF